MKIIITQQTTSYVIISLTCCLFSNVTICYHMCYHRYHITFNWLIKVFFYQSQSCNLLFLLLEDNILSVLSYRSHFQTIKQFTPWKFWSNKKSKYLFCLSVETFDWYLFQIIVLLKPDFNCYNSFALSWVDKVMTET